MRELTERIVRALVDSPDEVSVQEIEGERTTILELRVANDDVGKVIGKHGRTINAIRTVLKAAVTKDNKKVMLELIQ